jgi:hypothetical protein
MNHVGHSSTADDQGWPFDNHGIPDGTGLIVAIITETEQWATQAGLESLHGGLVKDRVCATSGGHAQVCHGSLLQVGEFEINIVPDATLTRVGDGKPQA